MNFLQADCVDGGNDVPTLKSLWKAFIMPPVAAKVGERLSYQSLNPPST